VTINYDPFPADIMEYLRSMAKDVADHPGKEVVTIFQNEK
jgi:hypothetical protein